MNMTLKRPFLLVLASLLILGSPLPALAETKTLNAEATYLMGDGETPSSAEAMVLQKAKQIALEQAGTYVESYTKIQNLDLTVEEIQTIAGGVLQVDVIEKKRSLVGDGLELYIKIRAAVTTDKMQELAQRIRGKNAADEYKRLQEEYVRLSKEIETWKQLITKTPQGAERNTALDQIREREKAFASLQSREVAFYQQLFSGEGILAEATSQLSKKQAHKEILEGLVQWITTKGYRITHQKPSVRTSIKKPGHATVTIPVSIALTTEARQRIVEVAEQLGGSMQTLRHPIPETMCGKDTFQKSSLIAFPVILSQDAELQKLLLELVNSQVLEISARKADDTIIFENSQKLMSQRVSDRDCSADPGRDIAPLRRYYLQTAPTSSKPLVTPFFSYALPTLEELYPGFEDIISHGRTKNEPDSDILKYINFEIEHIRRASPELSAEQLAEFSAGCRIFSDAYKAARDEERRLERAQIGAMIGMMGALMNRDSMASELARQHAEDTARKDDELLKSLKTTRGRELKLISKQPLKKPCRASAGSNQVPSQVFLIDQPVVSTFVIDLSLESIASIHNVQARVALKSTSK